MKYKKTKQYYEVEITMSESEVESIMGVFEQLAMVMNRPLEEMQGQRGDIYRQLKDIVSKKLTE